MYALLYRKRVSSGHGPQKDEFQPRQNCLGSLRPAGYFVCDDTVGGCVDAAGIHFESGSQLAGTHVDAQRASCFVSRVRTFPAEVEELHVGSVLEVAGKKHTVAKS